jgi:hypothetical protein
MDRRCTQALLRIGKRIASSGLVRIDHRGLESGHFGGLRTHWPDAIHDSRDRALARHLADIMDEIADRHVGIDRHLAIVGPVLASDHPEKRRLAGAIGPDKSPSKRRYCTIIVGLAGYLALSHPFSAPGLVAMAGSADRRDAGLQRHGHGMTIYARLFGGDARDASGAVG